jgi:hypothetical protein
MPPRVDHIPQARERSALQKLLSGKSLSLVQLYPAGENTIAGMVSKGWIVSEALAQGRYFRITPAGAEAFRAKIPDSK